MAASNSPPTHRLKKSKLSSSSVEENHRTANPDAAFQYLPDLKTTDCFKIDGEILLEEIIGEILARLPYVKSVIKCNAVCKSWKYLIQSPSFIDAHLRRRLIHNQNQVADNDDEQLADDDDVDVGSLHLLQGPFQFKGYLLYWDKPASVSASFLRYDSANSKTITNFTYRATLGKLTSSDYDLAGTCNGLIRLANDEDFTPEVPAILWKVRKFVTLPPSTITIPWTNEEEENVNLPYYISTSFGYDLRTNDYKVLRIIFRNEHSFDPAGNTQYGIEVYSLARCFWKILSLPRPAPPAVSFPGCHDFCYNNNPCPRNVFVNGAVHWLLPRDQSSGEDVVVLFDMAIESFGQIKISKCLRKTPGAGLPYDSMTIFLFQYTRIQLP